MVPLNIYLDRATPDELERAVVEYGNAIRDLAIANIFPGDMLWRNFGVTRYGRVVFYDYDEIEYLTDVTFRRHPAAAEPRGGACGRAVVRVCPHDVFPEEFATFLLGDPRAARAVPAPSRRPARAGLLAGVPAPDRGGGDRRLLPVSRVAPVLAAVRADLTRPGPDGFSERGHDRDDSHPSRCQAGGSKTVSFAAATASISTSSSGYASASTTITVEAGAQPARRLRRAA